MPDISKLKGIAKILQSRQSIQDNFAHITYKQKLEMAMDEWTNMPEPISWGWQARDDMFGGIYGGKIYTIGAETGSGKTTFVNALCRNVSKQGHRVVRYSLEDRMEDMGIEEVYYAVNRLRKADKKQGYRWVDFINKKIEDLDECVDYVIKAKGILGKREIIELDKKKDVTMEELSQLMEEECEKGAKLFAIDHLHYFEMPESNERMDIQIKNVMHRINEVARKRNVAVFLVAHYRNNTSGDPHPSRFKDGSAIKQVSNVIIQITRDSEDNTSEFHITKLRGPIKPTTLMCKFNLSTFEYDFKKSSSVSMEQGQEQYI